MPKKEKNKTSGKKNSSHGFSFKCYNFRQPLLYFGKIYIIPDSNHKLRRFIYLPKHPSGPHVIYARWLMENKLRRFLKPEEIVHHINLDTLDDRIENLRVYANKLEHAKVHAFLKGKCIKMEDDSEIQRMCEDIFGTNKQLFLADDPSDNPTNYKLGEVVIHGNIQNKRERFHRRLQIEWEALQVSITRQKDGGCAHQEDKQKGAATKR